MEIFGYGSSEGTVRRVEEGSYQQFRRIGQALANAAFSVQVFDPKRNFCSNCGFAENRLRGERDDSDGI